MVFFGFFGVFFTEYARIYGCLILVAICIPPIWCGLAFLQIRLPCCDTTTNDLNCRVDFAKGT